MTEAVREALTDLIRRTGELSPDGEFPRERYDADWLSPCQIGEPDSEGRIRWRPLPQSEPVSFAGLEHALELTIHPDIRTYYGTYWCAGIETSAEEGSVTLIQLWNQLDFERLVENLIGHALAKRRARQPLTLFFATTDPDSEHFLSVDNDTGKVLLEEPGKRPGRIVEENLASFIRRLTPLGVPQRIY